MESMAYLVLSPGTAVDASPGSSRQALLELYLPGPAGPCGTWNAIRPPPLSRPPSARRSAASVLADHSLPAFLPSWSATPRATGTGDPIPRPVRDSGPGGTAGSPACRRTVGPARARPVRNTRLVFTAVACQQLRRGRGGLTKRRACLMITVPRLHRPRGFGYTYYSVLPGTTTHVFAPAKTPPKRAGNYLTFRAEA